ncbi:MAG: ABC transporter permease [Patescibacteria group bacterium]|jgi:putative ABC transport system permease protein
MIFSDVLEETFFALSANKVRSGLTVLGIVIGISSVIAMTAIGQGAQNSVASSIESAGSNLIMVRPGASRSMGAGVSSGMGSASTLTLDDAEAIAAEVSDIEAVAPENSSRYQVTAKGTNTNTSVDGVTATYLEVKSLEIADGSFITEQNIKSSSKVAVLGPTVRDDLFGEDATDVIGQSVRINSIEFKVIGITEAEGGTGFGSQDDIIYIPISTAQKYLSGSETVSTINIKASSSEVMTSVQEEVTSLLLTRHDISDSASADFSVMNQADIIETASSVTSTFTTLLAAVAAISLLVGGIGIMNMMLTSVTERTKEIGLRKAIGAKRREISLQFLTESVVLTMLGGTLGVILGWLISFILSTFNIVAAEVSWYSVILSFVVSAAIGIVFGYYPARRAAGLNPIVALRYE